MIRSPQRLPLVIPAFAGMTQNRYNYECEETDTRFLVPKVLHQLRSFRRVRL